MYQSDVIYNNTELVGTKDSFLEEFLSYFQTILANDLISITRKPE